MREEQRRKITTITTSKSSYGASSNRTTLGYWIPLAITVTAATVALGAWIWSERDTEEDSDAEHDKYYTNTANTQQSTQYNQSTYGGGLSGAAAAAGAAGLGAAAGYSNTSGGMPPGPGPTGNQPPPPGSFAPQPPLQGGFQGPPRAPGGEAANFYRDGQNRDMSTGVTTNTQQDSGFMARMSNAVGLTRNDASGRNNSSGGGWASTGLAAAAGSVVGAAVNAVRGNNDDSQQHFSDQEKWSEEADKPDRVASPRKSAGSLANAGDSSRALTLRRTGTAAEFYSGEIDAPRTSSVISRKRKTVAIVVSAVDSPTDRQEVDAHQVSYSTPQQGRTNQSTSPSSPI